MAGYVQEMEFDKILSEINSNIAANGSSIPKLAAPVESWHIKALTSFLIAFSAPIALSTFFSSISGLICEIVNIWHYLNQKKHLGNRIAVNQKKPRREVKRKVKEVPLRKASYNNPFHHRNTSKVTFCAKSGYAPTCVTDFIYINRFPVVIWIAVIVQVLSSTLRVLY